MGLGAPFPHRLSSPAGLAPAEDKPRGHGSSKVPRLDRCQPGSSSLQVCLSVQQKQTPSCLTGTGKAQLGCGPSQGRGGTGGSSRPSSCPTHSLAFLRAVNTQRFQLNDVLRANPIPPLCSVLCSLPSPLSVLTSVGKDQALLLEGSAQASIASTSPSLQASGLGAV